MRDRTADLLNANQALSQLSYSPIYITSCHAKPKLRFGRDRSRARPRRDLLNANQAPSQLSYSPK